MEFNTSLNPKKPSLVKRIATWTSWLVVPAIVVTTVTYKMKDGSQVHSAVQDTQAVPQKQIRVLSKTMDFIEKNYVDPQAIDAQKIMESASKELVRGIPPLLIKKSASDINLHMGDKILSLPLKSPMTVQEVPGLISRMLGFLDLYYDGKLTDSDRLTLAMTGITDTLDPHTNYLPEKVFKEFKIGTKGNFGGLGIVIGIRDGDLSVISPLEGTPAFKAGIKAKDKIIQIGEESTINMSLTEAVERLRGPIGSKVTVVVSRKDVTDPMTFNLTRALIHIQSVDGKLIEQDGKKFGFIRIKNFQEDTLEQFQKTLHGFQKDNANIEGLVIDLRNNPGGLLDQAIAISDFFLANGTIVKTVGAHGQTMEVEQASLGDEGELYPLVVIVNEGSASASEIVSGALQYNDRAIIIGNRSFGKGSVQTVYDLKDGSALKITIAKYLTAKDQPVQSIGINPDVGLIPATIHQKVDEKDKQETRVDLYEDVKRRELDLIEDRADEEDHKDPNLPPPPLQMTYLAPDPKEDEDSGTQLKIDGDFPAELAVKILGLPSMSDAQKMNRDAVTKTIPPLLEQMKKEQEAKIGQGLSKLGVDWAVGPKEGSPDGHVTIEILDEKDNPIKALKPSQPGFIRVTVENKGSGTYYQLAGVTKSDDPLFANLEFPFGKIAPQEKKSWKSAIKIPDFVHRRNVPVELTFHEEYDRLPKSPNFSMEVDEPALPVFSYSYKIIDDGTQGSRGNSNHKIDGGETIALEITVKNVGPGDSLKPILNLKRDEGLEIFLEKGREELPAIASGKTATSILKFRVPASFSSSGTPAVKTTGDQETQPVTASTAGSTQNSKDNSILFDLNIHDGNLGEDLSDQMEFSKNASYAPLPGEWQTAPAVELSPSIPVMTTKSSDYVIKGKVTDDIRIKHFFIFVGDEKVFYQTPETTASSLEFETKVSLKKGANLITLASQDNREITSRKQWIVWREK